MNNPLESSPNDPRRRLPLVESLMPGATQLLLDIGRVRNYSDGAVVQRYGPQATSVILLRSGRLRVVTVTPVGREQLMRWMEPGEIAGLSALVPDIPFPADFVAVGDTEVVHLDPRQLAALVSSNGELGLALLRVQCLRVAEMVDILSARSLVHVEDKLMAALERLVPLHGRPVPDGIELRISQDDLADAASVSRQRVNLHLRQLQKRGVVRLGYRHVVILATPVRPQA